MAGFFIGGRVRDLANDFEKPGLEGFQHLGQGVSPFYDLSIPADYREGALLPGPRRFLDNTVGRDFRCAVVNRENREIRLGCNGVIAPDPGRDHAAVNIQNLGQFPAVKTDLTGSSMAASFRKPEDGYIFLHRNI